MNRIPLIGTADDAEQIIEAYSDADGLTLIECARLGFNEAESQPLREALGRGPDGVVTPAEEAALRELFTDEFVSVLASKGGTAAIEARFDWLRSHANRHWYRFLWNEPHKVRAQIIGELGRLGPLARSAAPEIASELDSSQPFIREAAAAALGQLGAGALDDEQVLLKAIQNVRTPEELIRLYEAARFSLPPARAVSALSTALNHQTPWYLKCKIIELLGQFGSEAASAAPQLTYWSQDAEPRVRRIACLVMGKIGQESSLDPLVARFGDGDLQVREEAANAVLRLLLNGLPDLKRRLASGSRPPSLSEVEADFQRSLSLTDAAMKTLSVALNGPEPEAVAGVLWVFGEALAHLEQLADAASESALRRSNEGASIEAEQKILLLKERLQDRLAPLTPKITSLASDARNWRLRKNAISALSHLRANDSEAIVGVLVFSLGDEKHAVTAVASAALARIGGPAVERLIQELSNPEPKIRSGVAKALVAIGGPAISPLIAGFKDGDTRNDDALAAILSLIGDAAVLPLVAQLDSEDEYVRARVIEALSGMPGDDRFLPLLLSVFDDSLSGEDVREGIIRVLGFIQSDDPSVLGRLSLALGDASSQVRAAASKALGKYGRSIVPVLAAALKDPSSTRREAAIRALAVVDHDYDEVISLLIEALEDYDARVQEAAVSALVTIGQHVIGSLVLSLGDPRDRLREGAIRTLGELGALAVRALTGQLGADNARSREGAEKALILMGPGILPNLEKIAAAQRGPAQKAILRVIKGIQNSVPAP